MLLYRSVIHYSFFIERRRNVVPKCYAEILSIVRMVFGAAYDHDFVVIMYSSIENSRTDAAVHVKV